ncbi:hypothetical protein M0804_004484 [Polistes exclamans]|nr:hypothetical protein M0804_004484 [Polistes exclamans]
MVLRGLLYSFDKEEKEDIGEKKEKEEKKKEDQQQQQQQQLHVGLSAWKLEPLPFFELLYRNTILHKTYQYFDTIIHSFWKIECGFSKRSLSDQNKQIKLSND